jgi:hypothetical protein
MRESQRKTKRDKMFSIYEDGVGAEFHYDGSVGRREANPLVGVGVAMVELMGERKYRDMEVFGKLAQVVRF